MSLKITTLIENMAEESGRLAFEHGFSVLVETPEKKILFDTGQTGAFVRNADLLKKDLSDVDLVILSHGHYDHTGGVPELLRRQNAKLPVYIGKEFFCPKYKLLEDGSYKYNGIPFTAELLTAKNSMAELHYIKEDITWLSETLVLFKNFKRTNDFERINPKFFIETEQGFEQDLFSDEIVLGVLTKQGLVLIAGCSHAGIINILEHVKQVLGIPVTAVLGGTHLVEAKEERLQKTVDALKTYGVKIIAVSHCTGEEGMKRLQQEFPDGFMLNNTGKQLEL